jgi:thioesterase domain-containing protein
MTDSIFTSAATRNQVHIVPLRTVGERPPLFCFPGSGGNIDVFRPMTAALPEGRPVYAIDMTWLCETDEPFTVEALAAYYLDIIRGVQKSGPYCLCGYSFGGLVAYETATRLVGEGDCVGLVALLDAPNPALISNLSKAEAAEFRMTYLIDRLKRYAVQLLRGDIGTFTSRGYAFIIARAGGLFMPSIKAASRMMNWRLPDKFRENDPGFLRAWRSYAPKHYPMRAVCFRAQGRGPEHDRDASMGWDACVMGGVDVHVVPGEHTDMMRMPSVGVIAEKLGAHLDRALDSKMRRVQARSDPPPASKGVHPGPRSSKNPENGFGE